MTFLKFKFILILQPILHKGLRTNAWTWAIVNLCFSCVCFLILYTMVLLMAIETILD